MYNYEEMLKELKKQINESRYNHVLRVRDKAIYLAKIYNAPIEQVETAALLHDIAKNFDNDYAYNLIEDKYKHIFENGFKINQILHGFAGASFVKKRFNITDELILNAIRYHTIGRIQMTIIDNIVYIADAIEDGRDYPHVDELRQIAEYNLDEAIYKEINYKLKHLIDKNSPIHPNTINLRNSLIK